VAGRDAILSGIGPSVIGPGEKKQPKGFLIDKGTVYLGSEIAGRLGAKPKSKIELAGRSFTVERVLAESGSDDDIRLYTALEVAQSLLGLPGRINEIKAIDCLCLTADQDPLSQLRTVLEKALPEGKVLQLRSLADARAKQRQMAERYAAFAVPVGLLGGALWVGLMTVLNVRERRAEIGLWRALGRGSGRIATLFLGKAALLGLLGAGLGYALGTALALRFGPDIFKVTAKALEPDFALLGWAALLTPVFAAVSAFLPAMLAVAQRASR
jgi:putative ABC transport system permease protein